VLFRVSDIKASHQAAVLSVASITRWAAAAAAAASLSHHRLSGAEATHCSRTERLTASWLQWTTTHTHTEPQSNTVVSDDRRCPPTHLHLVLCWWQSASSQLTSLSLMSANLTHNHRRALCWQRATPQVDEKNRIWALQR